MARAVHALQSLLHSRNPQIAASAHELDAAICVWADLPLQSARTRKASIHVAVLEERLAARTRTEARTLSLGAVALAAIGVALIIVIALVHVPGGAAPVEVLAASTL